MELLKPTVAVPLLIAVIDMATSVSAVSCRNENRLVHMGATNNHLAANITEIHNRYRLMIAEGTVEGQPRGYNLNRLYYDKQLALLARRALLACEMSATNVSDSRWYHVGQNMYLEHSNVSTTKPNWERAIAAWFNEHISYGFGAINVKSRFASGVRHYTQLVWAETRNVGCEFAVYHDANRANRASSYAKLYTCIYGPGGNVVGQTPYLVGPEENCRRLC